MVRYATAVCTFVICASVSLLFRLQQLIVQVFFIPVLFSQVIGATLFDLHSHSTCSDGILSPQALVSRAKERGVCVLALTDHDTLSGLDAAEAEATQQGITLINGIELSCLWQGMGVHIVGLNIDRHHPQMLVAVQEQEVCRDRRAEMIAERLTKVGIPDSLAGARAIAGDGAIGRPHFAHFLVACGAVPTVSAAFKKYLGAGKIGDVKQLWPSIEQVVGWITGAGGVAVLAHPAKYKLTRSKCCRLIEEFSAAGGQALEVVSGYQAPTVTRDLALLATRYNLYASCGSDFHVPDQRWQELGAFEALPESCRPVWSLWS